MPLNLVEIKSSRKIPNAPSLQGQGSLKQFQTLQQNFEVFFLYCFRVGSGAYEQVVIKR